ncbi:hypothetical protein GCM10020254_58210 [Streptomyces goshikiensis]
MHLAKRPAGGYRVHYAIADVAAFVTPGGALDAEAHRRVTSLYFPDVKVPLHPAPLSEGAASLLPDQTRPALLWRLDLDREGRVETADVRRALVRSRAKLDYEGVQKAIDAGTAEEPLALLKDIGRLRETLERERGGISLNVPEQEVVEHEGSYSLVYRAPLPADGWNAQISLMTGMAAADLMLAAGTGILRTLPTAPPTARSAGCGAPRRPCGSTGRTTCRTPNSSAPSTRTSPRTPRSSRSARPCCAAPGTRCSAAATCPRPPCTRPWRPRTRTAPPRCAGSSTATRVSCAWRRWPGRRPRSGRSRRWTRCLSGWRRAPGWRTRPSGSPWTSSRRPCSRTASGRPSRPR